MFGLGGRLFGALAGRPPTPVFVDEDEFTNFEEETLVFCACTAPLI